MPLRLEDTKPHQVRDLGACSLRVLCLSGGKTVSGGFLVRERV